MKPLEEIAKGLYETYCQAVDWVNYQGHTLPEWQDFRADPKKKKQSDAWIAVAEAALRID